MQNFLNAQSALPTYSDIFTLYRKLDKTDGIVKDMCYSYSDTIDKWWKFAEYIDSISRESSKYICDYSQSMENVSSPEKYANEKYGHKMHEGSRGLWAQMAVVRKKNFAQTALCF